MDLKEKILIGVIIVLVLILGSGSSINLGAGINDAASQSGANSSGSVEIGPDEDNRLIATSSNRSYLSITSNGEGNVAVYCEANNDAAATTLEGIKLATSTNMMYEYSAEKGNLFSGSLRCTATASTTVMVNQFIF